MEDLIAHLPGFFAAYFILLVGASSPGPAVAMLLGISQTQSRAKSLTTCVGIGLGSSTTNILTILGVGLILSQIAWAMTTLRILGALYLAWLAYGAFKRALHPGEVKALTMPQMSTGKALLTGYLLQVTNPKSIAFWLAIAAVGPVEGATLSTIVLFVLGGFLISFTCHAVWATLLSTAPFRAAYARGRKRVEATLGAFFAIAAFKLAITRI